MSTAELIQGSEAWLEARRGKITCSCFRFVMGSPAAQRSYLRLLRGESKGPSGPALEWGNQNEPAARADFEFETGLDVTQVGLILHPELDDVAGSPDGLIGEDEGIEIKNPYNSAVHIATLTSRRMPSEHIPQVQGLMWLSQRERWHFYSFDIRQPLHLRRFHQVIPRDDAYIEKLDRRVRAFRDMLHAGTEPADVDMIEASIPFL